QSFIEYMNDPEIDPRTGKAKHFEQVAFERWLDANPAGTTLLLDTIDVYMGAVHATLAATSTPARRRAFKGFRIDSGDLAESARICLQIFEANGLHGLMPILTGELDVEKVRQIVASFPEVSGFGIGTKLSSEIKSIAGVIFKQCLIDGQPTMKVSNSMERSTLPGLLQVFRGVDKQENYVGDITGLEEEMDLKIPGATKIERLLQPFWSNGRYRAIPSITKQRAFVEEQRNRFVDINNYPCSLSPALTRLRNKLLTQMRSEEPGWEAIVKLPQIYDKLIPD
ncbi:MAG: hypothetical protein ACRD4L_10065, partial [Pyrinomonadaceae bacterium]